MFLWLMAVPCDRSNYRQSRSSSERKIFRTPGILFYGIQWAFDAFDGTNREMMNFLEMHGHSFPQVTDPEILEQARTIGDTMPEWPADGSVSLQDGYILVHI